MVSLGTQPANRKSGFGHSSPTGARAQDLSRQPACPDLWGAGVSNDPGLPDPAPAGRPGRDRLRGHPHRHIAASNEGLIVGRPVRHAILCLIRGNEPSTASRSCGSCGGSREVRAKPPHPERVFMQQRRSARRRAERSYPPCWRSPSARRRSTAISRASRPMVPPVVPWWSRKVGAATPRHIIPATNACVGRRATGSIRAVRWRQSRQRRRIASSATRMRGWVRGWVSTSAGSTRA